jgi:hypothetical protein
MTDPDGAPIGVVGLVIGFAVIIGVIMIAASAISIAQWFEDLNRKTKEGMNNETLSQELSWPDGSSPFVSHLFFTDGETLHRK